MVAQHRAEERGRRGTYLGLGIGALVLLLVVLLLAVPGVRRLWGGDGEQDPVDVAGPQDTAAGTAAPVATDDGGETTAPGVSCDQAREVVVAAAPAIAPALEQAAADDECFAFTVQATPPGQVVTTLSAGATPEADVWVPDSTLWPELAAESGAQVQPSGTVLATSPVVLAGATDYVTGLDLGESPDWSRMLTEAVALRADDPQRDAASLLTLLHANAALSEEELGSQLATQALIQLGRELRPAQEWQEAALAGGQVVYPTSEQALSQAPEGLSALVPAGGLGVLSFPVVPLDEDATAAAEALTEAATGPDGAAVLQTAGFRVGEDGAGPGVAGVPEDAPSLEDQPDGAVVAQAFADYERITRPQRMLAVVDLSGSMDQPAGEGFSRIDVASGAAQGGLALMTPRTQVGLWGFSTNRGPGGQDWVEMVPLRTLSDPVGDLTQQQVLLAAAGRLDEQATTGDTGLHDTIAGAYAHMTETYDPDYVNSVVLLTDGINDDPGGGLSEEELLTRLQQLRDPERPVVLVLVGMGPEVDLQVLQRIVGAVQGQAYVAREPSEIGDVFVDALMSRQR